TCALPIFILDEPFSGFDPVNAEMIKDEILELNRNGATIIFSRHRMESVELLCNHIVLINKARKILDGSIDAIKNSYRSNTFRLTYHSSSTNIPAEQAPFDIIESKTKEDITELVIKIKAGQTANNALTY